MLFRRPIRRSWSLTWKQFQFSRSRNLLASLTMLSKCTQMKSSGLKIVRRFIPIYWFKFIFLKTNLATQLSSTMKNWNALRLVASLITEKKSWLVSKDASLTLTLRKQGTEIGLHINKITHLGCIFALSLHCQ